MLNRLSAHALFANARCPHSDPGPVDATLGFCPTTPQQLMEYLSNLGNVLLVSAQHPHGRSRGRCGLLCDFASQPLLRTCWLLGCSQITADGPHEWCQCVDRRGRVMARLHLLPDTDYAVWDRMLADSLEQPLPASLRISRRFRPQSARVVRFRLASLAGLQVFEQKKPAKPISLLSQRVAARLARTEALSLA